MSTHRIQVLGCILVFAALAACTSSGPGVKKLGNKDAGSTVHIARGGTLEIALDGNPTTGYTWEASPDAGPLLAQEGDPEFKADSSALGSGGIVTLRFKAIRDGESALKLIYHRTFEPNGPPIKTFDIRVIVEK